MNRSPNAVAVAVGLLLVVVSAPGFGVDFANDVLGFLVVAVAAWRARSGPAWRVAALLAALAAVAALFGYGGPVSHLVVLGDDTWTVLVAAEGLVGSAVFVAVLRALAEAPRVSGRSRRVIRAAAVLLAAAAVGWAAVLLFAGGPAGPWSAAAQGCAVLVTMLRSLTVVATLIFSDER